MHKMENGTLASDTIPHPEWRPAVTVLTLIFTFGLLCNGAVAIVFAFNKKLWTSFNVYLCNLLAANLLFFVLGAPFDVIDELYPHWWLGQNICTLYMYAYWTITPVQILTHCAMAVNRVWALYGPISYRNHHNIKTSMKTCAFLWAFAHILGLPGVIVDAVSFQKTDCIINAMDSEFLQTWQLLMNIMGFICIFTVTSAFLLVLCKMQGPRRVSGAQPKMLRSSSLTKFAENSHKQTVLLLMLTFSVFVLWSPLTMYEAVRSFMELKNPTVEAVFLIMFNSQALMDPILFVLTLRSVRNAALSMFSPGKLANGNVKSEYSVSYSARPWVE